MSKVFWVFVLCIIVLNIIPVFPAPYLQILSWPPKLPRVPSLNELNIAIRGLKSKPRSIPDLELLETKTSEVTDERECTDCEDKILELEAEELDPEEFIDEKFNAEAENKEENKAEKFLNVKEIAFENQYENVIESTPEIVDGKKVELTSKDTSVNQNTEISRIEKDYDAAKITPNEVENKRKCTDCEYKILELEAEEMDPEEFIDEEFNAEAENKEQNKAEKVLNVEEIAFENKYENVIESTLEIVDGKKVELTSKDTSVNQNTEISRIEKDYEAAKTTPDEVENKTNEKTTNETKVTDKIKIASKLKEKEITPNDSKINNIKITSKDANRKILKTTTIKPINKPLPAFIPIFRPKKQSRPKKNDIFTQKIPSAVHSDANFTALRNSIENNDLIVQYVKNSDSKSILNIIGPQNAIENSNIRVIPLNPLQFNGLSVNSFQSNTINPNSLASNGQNVVNLNEISHNTAVPNTGLATDVPTWFIPNTVPENTLSFNIHPENLLHANTVPASITKNPVNAVSANIPINMVPIDAFPLNNFPENAAKASSASTFSPANILPAYAIPLNMLPNFTVNTPKTLPTRGVPENVTPINIAPASNAYTVNTAPQNTIPNGIPFNAYPANFVHTTAPLQSAAPRNTVPLNTHLPTFSPMPPSSPYPSFSPLNPSSPLTPSSSPCPSPAAIVPPCTSASANSIPNILPANLHRVPLCNVPQNIPPSHMCHSNVAPIKSIPPSMNPLSAPIGVNKGCNSCPNIKSLSTPTGCTNISPIMPPVSMPSVSNCDEYQKCSDYPKQADLMLFKSKNVTVETVCGDFLKKTTITVLVPMYVSKLDV